MKPIFKMLAFCAICTTLFIGSCAGPKTTPTAMLMLHLHTNIDTNEVEAATTYMNSQMQNIQFTRATYYISNIKLTKTDGTIVPVAGNILVDWATEEYMAGDIPVGSYKSITFDVGVASADNHTDLSSHSGTDPLAAQTPSMHYTTTADGYIFMAVEGLVDSSGLGTPNKVFSYHIGTDALRKTVTMPDHSAAPYNAPLNAVAGGAITFHMIADYGVLFNGVDMKANTSTNSTTDNSALATTLANHIPSMFVYED